MTTDNQSDPANLLQIAMEAARAAGELIRERRPPGPLEVTATKTSTTDVVTVMDEAAERLLVDYIRAARPHDGYLGEEGADTTGSTGVTWVVDPIDGTVNYLYGRRDYAVSIGVRVGDQVIVGVVYNPESDEMWTACRGAGAMLDGEPIRANTGVPLEMALVATGFGYEVRRRVHQAEVLRTVLPRIRDIRRAGVASIDLCSVACGRTDAFYERGLKPWDLAAGGLIATEAGARVGGLGGRPADEDLVIAAAPQLFEQLEPLLAATNAAADS